MNLKEMTDEELISYRDDVREFMIAENEADMRIFQDVSKELISRLARGRKAIEALERIEQHAYRPIREVNHSCDYMYAIDDIKQIIKEATDDQG